MGKRKNSIHKAVIQTLQKYLLAKAELATIERRKEEIREYLPAHRYDEVGHSNSPADPVFGQIARLSVYEEEIVRLRAFVLWVEIGLDILPPRERKIIEARYLTSPPVPKAILAGRFFLGVSTLYQIERKALENLARFWGLDESPARPAQNSPFRDAN